MDIKNPQIGTWLVNLFSSLFRNDQKEANEITNAILSSICGYGYRQYLPLQRIIIAPDFKRSVTEARNRYIAPK